MSRKRKRNSWGDLLIGLLAAVMLFSFASGALQDIFDDGGSSGGGSSGSGGTVSKPLVCAHSFSYGWCLKCDYKCIHDSFAEAEDGNEYCTVCNTVLSLGSALVIRADRNKISWDEDYNCFTYTVYVNGQRVMTTWDCYFEFYPERSGSYEITVVGNAEVCSTPLSNSLNLIFYDVKFDDLEDHVYISGSYNGESYPFVQEGCDFNGYIVPLDGYLLPEEITVTMDGVQIGTDRYSYDNSTGALIIENVTGEVFVDIVPHEIAVPELSLSGSVVSWNEISEAKDYHIRVLNYGGEYYEKYFETNETSFNLASLNLAPGVYLVSVWVDTGDSFGTPATITYTIGDNGSPMKLATPFIYFM